MGYNVQLPAVARECPETSARQGYHELSNADAELLLDHYLALSADQRRARFGAMTSATALSSFVKQRDWAASWALGYSKNGLLHGVVELFPARGDDWRQSEIALTFLPTSGADRLRNELLQLALFEAGARGTEEIVVNFIVLEPWIRSLCAGRSVARADDQITISMRDISGPV